MASLFKRMKADMLEKAEAAKRQAEEAQARAEAKRAEADTRMKEYHRTENYPT